MSTNQHGLTFLDDGVQGGVAAHGMLVDMGGFNQVVIGCCQAVACKSAGNAVVEKD